jgi:GNAT superfamily N-acetyltransferase
MKRMSEMGFAIRPAHEGDGPDLHRNCFAEQTLAEVEAYLDWCLSQAERGRMSRLVAEAGGQVVASAQLAVYGRADAETLEGEIGSLVVAPGFRRRGMGTALINALIADARRRGLYTLEIMAAAGQPWIRAWYERLGFTCCGERLLPRGEQVVVLWMLLQEDGTRYTGT